jgi:hypothetical protein
VKMTVRARFLDESDKTKEPLSSWQDRKLAQSYGYQKARMNPILDQLDHRRRNVIEACLCCEQPRSVSGGSQGRRLESLTSSISML